MTVFHFLSVKAIKMVAVVSLNDVPLVRDLTGQGINTDESLNLWLLPGENNVKAYLAWPPHLDFTPGEAAGEISVFTADPAANIPRPGQVLAEFKWPEAGRPEAYPHNFQKAFFIKDPPPTRLWEEAAELRETTPFDHQLMVGTIEKFRQALLAHDAEQAYQLMSYRYADEAQAEGKPVEQVRAAILEQYQWLFERGELLSSPVNPAELTFKIVGHSKVVWVSQVGEEPALTIESADRKRTFGFDFYFSKIGSDWKIVR